MSSPSLSPARSPPQSNRSGSAQRERTPPRAGRLWSKAGLGSLAEDEAAVGLLSGVASTPPRFTEGDSSVDVVSNGEQWQGSSSSSSSPGDALSSALGTALGTSLASVEGEGERVEFGDLLSGNEASHHGTRASRRAAASPNTNPSASSSSSSSSTSSSSSLPLPLPQEFSGVSPQASSLRVTLPLSRLPPNVAQVKHPPILI